MKKAQLHALRRAFLLGLLLPTKKWRASRCRAFESPGRFKLGLSIRQYRAQPVNKVDDREPNSSGDHSVFDGCRGFFDKSPEVHEHDEL
jgi:hypothetical protein